jgi:hypothetical protein
MNPSRREALRRGAPGRSGAPVSTLPSAHGTTTGRALESALLEGGAR